MDYLSDLVARLSGYNETAAPDEDNAWVNIHVGGSMNIEEDMCVESESEVGSGAEQYTDFELLNAQPPVVDIESGSSADDIESYGSGDDVEITSEDSDMEAEAAARPLALGDYLEMDRGNRHEYNMMVRSIGISGNTPKNNDRLHYIFVAMRHYSAGATGHYIIDTKPQLGAPNAADIQANINSLLADIFGECWDLYRRGKLLSHIHSLLPPGTGHYTGAYMAARFYSEVTAGIMCE